MAPSSRRIGSSSWRMGPRPHPTDRNVLHRRAPWTPTKRRTAGRPHRRYESIGGVSPLSRHTAEQVAGIQQQLELRSPNRYLCFLGNKHSDPRIEERIRGASAAEARGLVGLVLAPHYSRAASGSTCPVRERAGGRAGMPAAFVEHWHEHPVLIERLAERVGDASGRSGATRRRP